MALDRERAGNERHAQHEHQNGREHGADLGQRAAAEHPPGRAHRFEHGLQEDLVMFLGVPERRRRVPRNDLGAGVHVGRRQLVADLLGHQAAEGNLFLTLVVGRLVLGPLGLVQERDHHDLRARLVDVHLECVADVGRTAVGVAGVDQVFARSNHDLAKPGQLADQVGSLLDDFLAADGLDHRPAGDLERDREPVAADQPLAVVDDRVGGLFQVERAVDLVGEPLELVPEPLLRHHLPHLAVLQIGRRQVAQVADKPKRALLLRGPPRGVHQDLEQADDLLVHHERGDDQREVGRVERLRNALDHRARRDDLRLRRLEHAAQQSIVRGGLDAAVHHPGDGKLDLILQPQPPRPSIIQNAPPLAATAATARFRNST